MRHASVHVLFGELMTEIPPLQAILRRRIRDHQLHAGIGMCGARGARLLNGRDETISESCPGFNEPRVTRGIAERTPQGIHGGIQAAVETHVHTWPEKLRQIVAHRQLSWLLQQEFENQKRLVLQFDADPVFAQLSIFEIHLEGSKAQLGADAHGSWRGK